MLSSCSADKFLSPGQTVLSSAKVTCDDKSYDASTLDRYIRQRPNTKWFGVVGVPLDIYCMAGTDTTRHRALRKLGEPPVVYDSAMSETTVGSLRSALAAEGYLHASAAYSARTHRHKTSVEYRVSPGDLFTIDDIRWRIALGEDAARIINRDSAASLLYKGMPLNAGVLSSERDRVVRLLQDNGYYNVNRDFVSFTADTLSSSRNVALTIDVDWRGAVRDSAAAMRKYSIAGVRVFYNVSEDSLSSFSPSLPRDTVRTRSGAAVYTLGRPVLRPHAMLRNVRLREGDVFSQAAVRATYQKLAALPITDYASVRMRQDADSLRADVMLHTRSVNSVSFEVEGTNMAGDLGAAAALSFENRNVFRGAETFGMKVRGAFEALNGLKGYNNDENYLEFSVEANLKMPLRIGSRNPGRGASVGNSEISLLYDTQDRPEFHRRTLTAGMRYSWNSWQGKLQHRLDLVSFNYVFMPWISDTFRRDYLENNTSRNSVLRYSYEDLFIMRSAYNLVFSSSDTHAPAASQLDYKANYYRVRFGVETAGNLLYLISRIFHSDRDAFGHYKLSGIAFAQYAKADVDFVKNFMIDERNAVALHAGVGLAVPYGNASIVPYEKRYFAGGANSVRGWSVRELGPGKYKSRDGKVDFINQTGNIKVDVNLEYRTFLFWKLHGAVFADAGNIWTTRDYPDQPGGKFQFNNFLKQLAAAYGLGLRLNLDYLVLRFDGGMKAVNPYYSNSREHFPIIHPRFSRDFTLHFAVGLPF